ncbi:hypothetical protein KUTeg_012077 [Tegillarca granosa]|uniref:EGF-like domain-containing protein n=1 Tax=Tegillarca granosa TaxID=220873 RepID=A0ABQ9F2U8_TEGGR|nr:hypothetical protein KUTeg_012077 [Tegillarca granosa]
MAGFFIKKVIFIFGCLIFTKAVRHQRNLIWSMSPSLQIGVSRIVGIEGDPEVWVPNANVTVRHISAPHAGWQFRGLAFQYATQTLYWSEKNNKRVQALVLNGSTSTRSVYTGTSKEVDGLVVDWVSNNLYLADPNYNWILLVPLNTTETLYKLITRSGLDKPHGLAVYPKKGYLFWSDWGEVPKIEMSDLLGKNRRILISTDVHHPRGLAVDYDQNILYWVDSFKDTVESVEFNGNSRRILIVQPGTNFFGIALFKKFLFVTEQEEGHLRIFDKYSGKGYINYQLGYIPFGVIMYDEETQEIHNGCRDLGCEQICIDNPPAGPQCYCADGYQLKDDQKSCEVSQFFTEPSHIYAIRDAICQYPAHIGDMSLVNITLDKQCFLKTSKGFLALTFDGEKQTLYYTENNTNSIGRVQLRRGAYTDTIIRGVGEVKGLALDWTTDNLYWTDSTKRKIMVAKVDGRFQKALINSDLQEPLGIAVHPKRGRIYWTDPGRSVIETSLMTGDGRQSLDMKTAMYAICKYDLTTGTDEILYRQQFSSFYGVSVYQDFLIWTDSGDMNGIHVADMLTLTKKRGILHPQVGKAGDVILYDKLNQPKFNGSCAVNNGGCDQLCLSSFCSCGVGFELSDDLKTCYSDMYSDNFVLVADAYQKQIFQVGIYENRISAVSLSEHFRPIALDYDPIRQKIYWTDNEAKTLKQANIDGGSEVTMRALTTNSVLDGVAVDYLNNLLYYTDAGLDTITVVSLSKIMVYKTIITEDLAEPRDIVVHPSLGRMFWSDWGKKSKIEAADMDGNNRMILVNFTTTAWPNGIAMDYYDNRIYWIDARNDKIESIDIDGKDRRLILLEDKTHYFGLSLSGPYLYFTDWTKNYISRIRDNSTDETTIAITSFPVNTSNSVKFLNSKQGNSNLQVGGIVAIAIVCGTVTIIAIVASVMLYRRWRFQFIPHDRLVEDNHVGSFYRIAFPDNSNKFEPQVDIGIENPYYNRMVENNS